MFTISQQPPVVALSGSSLIFAVSSDRDEEFYRVMALPFPDDPDTGDLLSLNQNNQAFFDLHEYFAGTRLSEFVLDNVFLHVNACKPAQIRFKEYFGNPPEAFGELTFNGNVLGGFIPRWKQNEFRKLYSSFYDYLLTVKPYLTWSPRTFKRVLPEQPERLYFLNTNIAATLKIIVGVYFDDGTFALLEPERSIDAGQYQVVSFGTGFNALGLQAWADLNHLGKKITHYYISITRDGYGISEPFSYKVDYNNYRNVRYIVFKNSLSGWDVIACTGEYDETTEIERSTASRVADVSDLTRLHKVEYRHDLSQIVKVNTGWLSIDDKEWLTDLLISDEVYELINDMLNPILIRTKQLDTTDRIFSPGDAEIEYERLFLAE